MGNVLEVAGWSPPSANAAWVSRLRQPHTIGILWRVERGGLAISQPAVAPGSHYAVQYLAAWFCRHGARATLAPTARQRSLARSVGRRPEPVLFEVRCSVARMVQLMPALRRALWQQKHAAVLIAYEPNRVRPSAALTHLLEATLRACGATLPARICRDLVWRRHVGQLELLHHCDDKKFAVPWPTGASGNEILHAVARQCGLIHGDAPTYLRRRVARSLEVAKHTIPFWREAGPFGRLPVLPKAAWQAGLEASMAVPLAAALHDRAYYVGGSSGTTGESSLVVYEAPVKAHRVASEEAYWARPERPRFVALNRPANLFGWLPDPNRFRTAMEGPRKRIISPGENPTTASAPAWRRVSKALASFGTTALAADAQYLMGWACSEGFAVPSTLRELIYATNASWSFQRRELQRRIGRRGRALYHCGEVGAIAISCARGAWHLIETNVYYEIFNRGRPAAAGEPGLLLISTTDTHVRPLFRYPLGDVVAWAKVPCACGTPGRTVVLEGRLAHVFADGRGRYVTMRALDGQLQATTDVAFLRVVRDEAGLELQYIGGPNARLPVAKLSRALGLAVRATRVAELPLHAAGGKLPLLSVPNLSDVLFPMFTRAGQPPIRWA
ncbi:MAG: hypothetical protein IPL79_01815 [Myxococcales bacterium]|nr:hypothetical protein [Myxococcales bacterium]